MNREPQLIALDTEDDSDGNVYMVNFFDGIKHTTFVRDEKREKRVADFLVKCWNYLYVRRPAMVWACNLEYDLINLFGDNLGHFCTLQYVSSGILRATWFYGGITFYDTLRHWPASVEQMGHYLGLPKLDADFRSVEYCRRDTEIVWRFTREMIDRYTTMGLSLKATLPAMALQLFTAKFYPKDKLIRLPDALVSWFREGYYGGRVEVYRFGEIDGPIHHYDVNSLFPSVMVDGVYPDLHHYHETTTPKWEREGMADITITLPWSEYPALPVRGEEDILYPYGTFRGTWTYPEIRQALADKGEIQQVHRAVEHRALVERTPFKGYVEFCYRKRRKAERGSLDDVLWKLMMNSLYGKFGQRGEIAMIYQDRDLKITGKPSPAANVLWAAYVTALARVRLLSFLRSTTACYYTDTDSLLTPDILSVSPRLGKLKEEGTYLAMEAVGNKMYALDMPATEKVPRHWAYKAKGVPRQVAGDFIRTGKAVFRKPARFRESRRTGAVANKWYNMEKIRAAVYTKRIVRPDGTTEPWPYDAYLSHMLEA